MDRQIHSQQASFSTTSSVRASRLTLSDDYTTPNAPLLQDPPHPLPATPISLLSPQYTEQNQPSGETIYLTATQQSTNGCGSLTRKQGEMAGAGMSAEAWVTATSLVRNDAGQTGGSDSPIDRLYSPSSRQRGTHGYLATPQSLQPDSETHIGSTPRVLVEPPQSVGDSDTQSIIDHRVLREGLTARYVETYDPLDHLNLQDNINQRHRFSRLTDLSSNVWSSPTDTTKLREEIILNSGSPMARLGRLIDLITNPFLHRSNLPPSSLEAQQDFFEYLYQVPEEFTPDEIVEPGHSGFFSGAQADPSMPLPPRRRVTIVGGRVVPVPDPLGIEMQPILPGHFHTFSPKSRSTRSTKKFPEQIYICRGCSWDYKRRPLNAEQQKCWMMLCEKCKRDMGKVDLERFTRIWKGMVVGV